MTPQSEAITFAPEEHVMDEFLIPSSGDGPRVGAPTRHGNPVAVMYI